MATTTRRKKASDGPVLDAASIKLTEYLTSEKPGKYRNDKRSWEEWKAALWRQMYEAYGYPGLAFLEQCAYRSQAEQRCIECGEPGAQRIENGPHSLIHVPQWYWHCQGCADYWAERARQDRLMPHWDPAEYEFFPWEHIQAPVFEKGALTVRPR